MFEVNYSYFDKNVADKTDCLYLKNARYIMANLIYVCQEILYRLKHWIEKVSR